MADEMKKLMDSVSVVKKDKKLAEKFLKSRKMLFCYIRF